MVALQSLTKKRGKPYDGKHRFKQGEWRSNPVRNGKRLLCSLCDSKEHLVHGCLLLKQIRSVLNSKVEIDVVGALEELSAEDYEVKDSLFGYIQSTNEAIHDAEGTITVLKKRWLV